MSFLILKDNVVECTPAGMLLPEVSFLYNKKKVFFKNVITAIYFLYTPRTLYWNKSLEERIVLVDRNHLDGTSWAVLSDSNEVKALVEVYINLTQTVAEKMEETLKQDMNDLMHSLRDVPSRVPKTISVGTEVMCDDDVVRLIKVEKTIYIANQVEKEALWKFAMTLSKNFKEIQSNLQIEEDERLVEESTKRMFDGTKEMKRVV